MRDGDATCEGPGSWQSHLEEGGSIPAQLTAAPPPGAAAETARTGSQTFTSLVRLLPPLHQSLRPLTHPYFTPEPPTPSPYPIP